MAKDMLPIAAFYALYKRVCNQVPKCSSSEDRVINVHSQYWFRLYFALYLHHYLNMQVFRNLRHQVQQFELFSEEVY